ncbi:HAD-IA family hydrolase [Hydrogenophaga sp. MI9]|uniref:HAD-IA family hydrolase n=1 Tax=Hydrogenophaga sp. MI9 TaxID=3453719 RepID=UPI003EF038C9
MSGERGAKALVLDFGGVISRMLFETHALSEQALGLPPGTLTWKGPFDPATDPLWQDMLADKLSERDYWMARTREVGRLLGEDWDKMETFVQRARGADVEAVIRPEAVSIICATKAAGRKLAILSNELDLFYGADFRRRLPLLQLFDVTVDATYTGILKPDPRAYAAVTEALGLPAGECVFVDDQQRNADGGVKAGMQVVHFDVLQPTVSFAKARELLGL